jgi:hypothetical protein
MTALRRYCSLMGQVRKLPLGVDAFGCLRSLRARSALDGVSWVQGGSVEIAVGQRFGPATESAPSPAPSLGRRSSWELLPPLGFEEGDGFIACGDLPYKLAARLAGISILITIGPMSPCVSACSRIFSNAAALLTSPRIASENSFRITASSQCKRLALAVCKLLRRRAAG